MGAAAARYGLRGEGTPFKTRSFDEGTVTFGAMESEGEPSKLSATPFISPTVTCKFARNLTDSVEQVAKPSLWDIRNHFLACEGRVVFFTQSLIQ